MTVAAGSRLGPYEITGRIGAGGMGEVYRARDSRLGRSVAVKVLPPQFASDPDRLRRFEQEARAVAALSHPNVLAVYDVGTHEGSPFIVTELLEGESLRDRLRVGGLTVRKAVETAVQIAQGLAAAHEKGIVHRDLKPGNVFVTANGQVKILDFGLAKLTQSETTHDPYAETVSGEPSTESGAVLGTMGYTSPEQLRGDRADARSDIFSFGCVLYEMLSGVSPFLKRTGVETVTAIMSEDPAPLSGTGRAVAPALQEIASRCLEKRPEDRFSSAHDLALALRAVSGGSETPATVKAPRHVLRRRWLLAAAAAVVLLVAGGALLWRQRAQRPTLDPKRVVVAIFENRSGDSSLDALGRLAAESISEGLSRTGIVDVVPSSTVFALARQGAAGDRAGVKDPARRLADETGARLVVSGAYYVQGGEIRVHAAITDATTGRSTPLEQAVAAQSAPEKAVDSVRQRVMGAIAVRFDATAQVGSAGTAPDYRAYQEYLAGQELMYQDDGAAIARFTRALEIDPTFVAARIAVISRAFAISKPAEAASQLAILETQRERLTPAQQSLLAAFRARAAGRHEEALAAVREAARLTPNDVASAFMLATYAGHAYHLRESAEIWSSPLLREQFETKTGRGSRRWMYWWNLGLALHFLGEDERALAEVRRGRALNPDAASLVLVELLPLAGLARIDEIEPVIDEGSRMPSRFTRGDLMETVSVELRWHGHREAGVRWANRAVEWGRGRSAEQAGQAGARLLLAHALCLAERWDEARPLLQALVHESRDDTDSMSFLGIVAARRGERSEAMRISEELRRVERPSGPGGNTVGRAGIAAHIGEKERAFELLREALAEGYSLEGLHADFRLEPLRGYPPFEELMKPKG